MVCEDFFARESMKCMRGHEVRAEHEDPYLSTSSLRGEEGSRPFSVRLLVGREGNFILWNKGCVVEELRSVSNRFQQLSKSI